MKVRYTSRARDDLDEIFSYIANENPQAAQRVQAAILTTIKFVAARPYIGIKNARSNELRSRLVPRYPYRVHYFVHAQEVWILHIRHAARRPLE
jgi:toxin ParE1/3/4